MKTTIEYYINKMKKEDIIKYANKNNLKISNSEIDFIYDFIKNNYQEILKDPNKFDITLYKNRFSNDNYIFISNLINKYKKMIL